MHRSTVRPASLFPVPGLAPFSLAALSFVSSASLLPFVAELPLLGSFGLGLAADDGELGLFEDELLC